MNLFSSSWRLLGWFNAVMRVFSSTHPVLSRILIATNVLASITRLLAFFIPLKVLLLIATPGVPKYFQLFIEPEYGTEWAIGLSIAAVFAYLLTIALEKLAERLSEVGSRELLEQVSQMAVFNNQRALAKGYFSDFTGVVANILLTVILMGLGFWLYPLLFLVLLGAFVLQFLATGLVLSRLDEGAPRGLSGYIHGKLSQYLSYLEAFNFLLVFGFLVGDFILFDGVNILIAILSFIMARRLLPAVSAIFSKCVSLSRQRHRIDPLVFADKQYFRKEPGRNQKLLRHYRLEDREARLLGQLRARLGDEVSQVTSQWVDPGPAGVNLFSVQAFDTADSLVYQGQEQVGDLKRREALDNEALIVDALGHAPLCMATTAQEYQLGEFECRLMDVGEGKPVNGAEWKKHYLPEFMTGLWCVQPDRQLREIFELSRPYLGDRINETELERMEVAMDTAEKRAIRDALREALPTIRELLAALPVFPFNHALNLKMVFRDDNGKLLVTDWSKWSLEPVGVGLAPFQIQAEQAEAVSRARRINSQLDHRAMRLASRLFDFEDLLVAKGRYNEALKVAAQVLEELQPLRSASEEPGAVQSSPGEASP